MNNFQIFNSEEFERIKAIEDKKNAYIGFIYILEYGKDVKIGYTQKPTDRIKALKRQATYGKITLGNIAISKPHTNFRNNEKLLHQYFKQYNISGTELFSIQLNQVLSDLPDNLKFLDESERLTQKAEQNLEILKNFLSHLWGIDISKSATEKIIASAPTYSLKTEIEANLLTDCKFFSIINEETLKNQDFLPYYEGVDNMNDKSTRKRVPLNQLKSGRIWTNWVLNTKDGKNIKMPLSRVNDPATWLTFEEAYQNTFNSRNGIGIMFANNGRGSALCGIDIDAHNVDTNPLAKEIIDMFSDTYIERSPSGKGYHILFLAELDKLPKTRQEYIKLYKQKNIELDVECYIGGITNRYFTFTGNQTSEHDYVTDKTDTLLEFLEKYMKISSSASSDNQSNQLTFAEQGNFEPIIDMNTIPDDSAVMEISRKRTDNPQNKRSYDDSKSNTELIKPLLIDYIQEITQASKGTNQYICPLCSSGTGKNATGAFTYYPDTDSYNCFACGEHGDIFTLYSKMNNLSLTSDFPQIVDDLERKFNLPSSHKEYSKSVVKFEDIAHQREHIYTDKQGNPVAKKIITKYFGEYTNKRGKTHKAGDKTTLWQRYDTQTQQYIAGLYGLKMPLYHLHCLSSAEVIIIAEGEKDVETLERMGYTATSSPNGAGSNWKSDYNKYLIGKRCIVLTDNDQVGEKAGIQTAESLAKSNIPVKLIRATDIYDKIQKKGDISDIAEAVGIEKAIELLQNAITSAIDYIPNQESKSAPGKTDELPEYFELSETTGKLRVNAALLAEHIRKKSHYFFVRNSAFEGVRRYWYSENGVYNMVSDSEIQGIIKGYITQYDLPCLKMKYVKDAFLDLTTDLRFISEDDVNSEEKYINFKNGFMNLLTGELITHSPEIKSTIQLNAEYNPKKQYTLDDAPIFKKYIEDLTECDVDKQQLLLEYLGGCLSNINGYRFKKALFLVGESNAGKSQFIKLICELLGKQNFASIGFADLDERFQSGVTYGKRLVCDPDMKIMRAKSNARFMNMTGGDPISIEFKGLNGFSSTYKGFLLFASNDLPKWSGNTTEAAYNRMIILTCNNAIPEDKRDPELLNKMLAERETIICCALSALREAVKRHYTFTIPYDCILTQQELRKNNSPSIDFFTGWCIQYPDSTSNIKHCFKCSEMYLIFTEWCRIYQNGYTPTKRMFRNEILTYLKVDEKNIIRIKDGTPYYKFTLTPEAKEEFRRYDSPI